MGRAMMEAQSICPAVLFCRQACIRGMFWAGSQLLQQNPGISTCRGPGGHLFHLYTGPQAEAWQGLLPHEAVVLPGIGWVLDMTLESVPLPSHTPGTVGSLEVPKVQNHSSPTIKPI